MYFKSLVLFLAAFFSGCAVSAGTFAFLLVIGIVPRMLRRTNLFNRILTVETSIILGVIVGNVMSLWERAHPGEGTFQGQGMLYVGHFLLAGYGLSAGVFVGCIAVALAEILDTFPILFRRFRLEDKNPSVTGENTASFGKTGTRSSAAAGDSSPKIKWLLLFMAAGKLLGSLYQLVMNERTSIAINVLIQGLSARLLNG